jgi:hypothetical protein
MNAMQANPSDQPIPGHGIDADPKNDPTYPMRLRDPSIPKGISWERPPLQSTDREVLHSNEHPGLTAVFGTAVPPCGLSGVLRRYAFKHSESTYRHWLSLMAADRINIIEGVFHDFAHGRVPNIFAERGLAADWRFNRGAFITKCIVAGVIVGAVAAAIVIAGDER